MSHNLLTETPEGVAYFSAVTEGVGSPRDIALSIIRLNALGLLKGPHAKENLIALSHTAHPKVIPVFFNRLIKTDWLTPEITQEILHTLLFHAQVLSHPHLLRRIDSLPIVLSKEIFDGIIQIATNYKNDAPFAWQVLQAFLDDQIILHQTTIKEEMPDDEVSLSTLIEEIERNLSEPSHASLHHSHEQLSESSFLSEEEELKPLDEEETLFGICSFFDSTKSTTLLPPVRGTRRDERPSPHPLSSLSL